MKAWSIVKHKYTEISVRYVALKHYKHAAQFIHK